jgi:hypothetical protein
METDTSTTNNTAESEQMETVASNNAADVDKSRSEVAGEKTFTQTEVSRFLTKEKNQGRAAAYRDLGIDPKDSAAIQKIKDWIAEQKPESQKLAEKQIEENNQLKDAEHRAFLAEIKAEILTAGIQPGYIDDATALIAVKQNDAEFDLQKTIETIKTKYPVWFTASKTEEKPEGHKGTGHPINPGRSDSGKPQGIGERLAAQRKEGAVKSVFWGQR